MQEPSGFFFEKIGSPPRAISSAVAERHYAGQLRGIPRDSRTLDAAMRIERVFAEVIDRHPPPGSERSLAGRLPERSHVVGARRHSDTLSSSGSASTFARTDSQASVET